jgi:hypothetical protein
VAATSASRKRLPPPAGREDLGLNALVTDADAEQMMQGLVPEEMEDKWFIYFDSGWLFFHRSWTGALIYALRFDGSPAGVRVVESWVNRNPRQYSGTDTEYDRRLVHFLIRALLLRKADACFPMRAGPEGAPKGVVQHNFVGRAYPESKGEGSSGDA